MVSSHAHVQLPELLIYPGVCCCGAQLSPVTDGVTTALLIPAVCSPTVHLAVFVCSAMRTETGEVIQTGEVTCGLTTGDVEGGNLRNNYSRPEGQNVGNFISDRPTSRVLAAPGGTSSIVFGTDDAPAAPAPRSGRAPGALAPSSDHQMSSNNYARPDGQNCGNFLTDRKVGA